MKILRLTKAQFWLIILSENAFNLPLGILKQTTDIRRFHAVLFTCYRSVKFIFNIQNSNKSHADEIMFVHFAKSIWCVWSTSKYEMFLKRNRIMSTPAERQLIIHVLECMC